MHQHGRLKEVLPKGTRKIALVGSPNVGKSVVFNRLSGRYVTVSNYPGTTVEVSRGLGKIGGKGIEIIDTPGAYSLVPMSEDEKVTRRLLIKEKPDLVLQIADAKNLRRMLPLTFQLIEIGFPLILVVNMLDEARERGIELDLRRLAKELGIPVVGTVATTGRGIRDLKKRIDGVGERSPPKRIAYSDRIEEFLGAIDKTLKRDYPISRRSIGLALLEGDKEIYDLVKIKDVEKVKTLVEELQKRYRYSIESLIRRSRDREAGKLIEKVAKRRHIEEGGFKEFLGRFTMRPLPGFITFILVLYLMYEFVGVLGAGMLVDFFEETLFGEYFNPWFTGLVEVYIPVKVLQELLVGEYGLVTMGLTYSIGLVLPIVTTFFIAFGFLEDVGYFPRLTIMANRIFKKIGLSGKAALPMILGLGCVTMATLTTRILGTKKERAIATLLLALGIPCSAQLGVILGISASISSKALLLIFGVVGMQILIVGALASRIIPGEGPDFLMEIPPIRMPNIANILLKTYTRVAWFLVEAVPLFLLGTFILFVLDKIGLLLVLENVLRPVVSGVLGLPTATTQAFIMGFLRRDYGAAGLFALARAGQLGPIQTVVSLVVIILFVPCIANFFVIIKERGIRFALSIVAFIMPYAILVGSILNYILRAFEVRL